MKRYIAATAVFLAISGPALAQDASKISDGKVRIGLLADLTSIYADLGGPGSVVAAKMAADDFGGAVLGAPIEILSTDVLNKTDIAVSKAREWFDGGVDMVLEGGTSSSAVAVAGLSTEKKKIYMPSSPGTSLLTNEKCGPYVVHYTYDTYSLANVAARAIVGQNKKDWFFITSDNAFGLSVEKDTANVLAGLGASITGHALHPIGATDFASYIIEAERSKASVVAIANGGSDTQNAIKAANEFGLMNEKQVVALLLFLSDVHALGLKAAQGMLLTDAWYWDQNEETRAFAHRFYKITGKMPTMVQAGNYSAVLTYLKAIQAAGTDDPDAVMAAMKKMRVNDMFAKNGYVREDGRFIHDMNLVQVKSPEESKGPYDYYKIKATIPGDEAFQPLSASRCPLVKK